MILKNKCCQILAVIITTSLFFVSGAGAADCSSATIKSLGIVPSDAVQGGTSNYFVNLDCSDDSQWPGVVYFFLSSDLGDAGYATLLTASSLDKPVWVRTGGTTGGSVLFFVSMNN